MRKVTYTDLNDINNLKTVTLVKNSVFAVTARINDEDNILVEFITLDDLETKKAKILETENLSFSEIVQTLNGKDFWQSFDDYIGEFATQTGTNEEEEEKSDSYLFSYDTLRAVFENKKSDGNEFRMYQLCISISHDELGENSATISCKNFDRNSWSSDIDEQYDIELEDMTFLEFVGEVKAFEEEILEDIRNLRDYHNEKGQEFANTYNEIKEIIERD